MRDYGSTRSTPRWVKTTASIFIALLLLFGSFHLAARTLLGQAFGWHGRDAPPSSATERGQQ